MKIRQWEVWKCKPAGFEKEHWFIIVSGQERLDDVRYLQVNGLACFTLRGQPKKVDVQLNGADGFQSPSVCQCDLLYFLDKSKLHTSLGLVSWERQQQIKELIKHTLRI